MSNKSPKEEISIKELMQLCLELWNKVVQLFLKAVLFVIKHAIPLVLLIAIGLGIAYINKDKNLRYKREYVVSTTQYNNQFLSKELRGINVKFAANDERIKKAMSLQDLDLSGVQFSVNPIFEKGAGMSKEEYQYIGYLIENKLVSKENLESMVKFSDYRDEVIITYPKHIDGKRVFEATLNYLRSNEYVLEMHEAILSDIELQIEQNKKLILSLGNYVASLGKNEQKTGFDSKTILLVEGARGSNLGPMLYARTEVQELTNMLIARKIRLSENLRVLHQGYAMPYYGSGIMSKKLLVYPILLVGAYLFIVLVIYIIQAALALKEKLRRKEA